MLAVILNALTLQWELCVCLWGGGVFLMAFLFLKEKLRAVLGLGQYYLRDVFHAPRFHIYVAYLPERSIKPHEPAPAHQHPTSTFSWSCAVHVLGEMHMLQHQNICPNGPC